MIVGIDVGTTAVKAVAIDVDGEVLAREEESYELSTPQPGWAEQDPEDWWRAISTAAKRLLVGRPFRSDRLAHTLLPWGAHDDRADYDYAEGVELRVFELGEGQTARAVVHQMDGSVAATFTARRAGDEVTIKREKTHQRTLAPEASAGVERIDKNESGT